MLLPPASSAPTPLAEAQPLDGVPSGPPPLPPRKARTRMVSSAGPAMPVAPPKSDVAPTSWSAQPAAASAPSPPPLPPRQGSSGLQAKPAHLRVGDQLPPAPKPSQFTSASLDVLEVIQSQDLDIPQVPQAKQRRDSLVKAALLIVVLAGLAGVYWVTRSEPAPEVQVDPALQAEAARKKRAVQAMEKGHTLAIEGEHTQAAEAYRKALSIEPSLASAERGLAIALTSLEKPDEAVVHYRRYLELEPGAADAPRVRKIIAAWEKAHKSK